MQNPCRNVFGSANGNLVFVSALKLNSSPPMLLMGVWLQGSCGELPFLFFKVRFFRIELW